MNYTETSIGAYDQQENAGFVRCAYLIDQRDVLGILDPVRFKNALPGLTVPVNGISVTNLFLLTKLERLPLLGTFDEPRLESGQGDTYQPVFSFELPRNTPEFLKWIHDTQGRRFVVLWEDRNGYAHISGNEDNGLRVQLSRQIKESNGMVLQLTAQMPVPTWGLESIDPAALFPLADFSYEFSLFFNA